MGTNFSLRKEWLPLAAVAAACTTASVASQSGVVDLSFADAGRPLEGSDPARSTAAADRAAAAVAEPPCSDVLAGELARLSCDGQEILVKTPIELHPRARPSEPTRSVLAAVAALLDERQDILLVRIEVHSSRRVGGGADLRRLEWIESQARADAILQRLWRTHRVSAERLEAVGFGASEPPAAGASRRWRTVLRVVQRRRRR